MLALQVQLYSDLLPNLILTFSAFEIKLSCKKKELEAILVFPKGEIRPSPPCCGKNARVASHQEGQVPAGSLAQRSGHLWGQGLQGGRAGGGTGARQPSSTATEAPCIGESAEKQGWADLCWGKGGPSWQPAGLVGNAGEVHGLPSGPANAASDALGLPWVTARPAVVATALHCLYPAIKRGIAKTRLQPPEPTQQVLWKL